MKPTFEQTFFTVAALFLTGIASFIIYSLHTEAECKAWGWQGESNVGICVGELDSGEQIQRPLKEIQAQTCVGPYQNIKPTSKNKHPNGCPSGIHFSGGEPFFQNLKIRGDVVTY